MSMIWKTIAAEFEHNSESLPAWWAFPVFLLCALVGGVLTGLGLYLWDHSIVGFAALLCFLVAVTFAAALSYPQRLREPPRPQKRIAQLGQEFWIRDRSQRPRT